MIRNADRSAMGGPLEKLTTGAGDTIDPRFERLGLSIARMDALERGLDGGAVLSLGRVLLRLCVVPLVVRFVLRRTQKREAVGGVTGFHVAREDR